MLPIVFIHMHTYGKGIPDPGEGMDPQEWREWFVTASLHGL